MSGGAAPDGGAGERRTRAASAIAMIDLTDLADDHAPEGIQALCSRAVEFGTAAVCVWPEYVAECAERVAGSGVRVATVVNFPSGAMAVTDVVAETQRAIADGADEIDVVLPYGALLAGDDTAAVEMLTAVREAAAGVTLKVILETGELVEPELIRRASALAVEAGADFIKTSTGKTAVGATPEAAEVMLGVIAAAGRTVGLKPSGGIRSYEDAAGYLALAAEAMGPGWASPATFRFGASSLLDSLLAEIALGDGPASAAAPAPDAY